MSYTVVARGREVIKRLERVLPHAAPIQGNATAVGGRVDLQPGTLVMPQRMLVVGKIGFEAVWLDFPKAELRSVPEQQFLNGFFLGQVVSEVDRRTAWLTPVSRATMAFTMGVMSGALGWFAVAGAAGAGALSASVAIYRNQHKLAMVTKHLGEVLTILLWFRSNCPVTYDKMTRVLGVGVVEALKSVPQGFTANDIANLAGRMAGGLLTAPEGGLKILIRICGTKFAMYTALHLPQIATKAATRNAADVGGAMIQAFKDERIALSPADEQAIVAELSRAAGAAAQIAALGAALEKAAPAVEELILSMTGEQTR